MKKSKLIWALVDDRTGNRNQILGVLKELKLPHRIFNIRYNHLGRLPNFIIQILGGRIHLRGNNNFNITPYPSLIISCGRRTFPIAKLLKNKISPKPFLAHLMYPKFSLNINSTDIIFTPEHDITPKKSNLVKTLGTPNQIKYLLDKDFTPLKNINKPIISILLGGDHGHFKLNVNEVKYIIDTVIKKIKNKGSIIISTSRRTSDKIILMLNKLKKKNAIISYLYHPKLDKKNNTLAEILFNADEIVVTGDSMSMVSECCEINKPIRIYFNKRICSVKHLSFCRNMIKEGYAFPFETLLKKCNVIKTLDTSKLISKRIKSMLKNGRN